ncbi:MAG: hypothetical protein QXQ19_02330 [Candidatus Aenigmatarchaeota archaeon]
MKTLIGNLILFLLPLVLFIIAFYLTAGILSREISVIDISSKIFNVINEAEIYKQQIRNITLEKLKENNNLKEFSFSGYYTFFKISIIERDNSKIKIEVFGYPKEEIIGIRLIIHYIDEIKLW